tara:strand:+ start:9604 stop:10500 length:897 start_codon:yes stop_codon:yes gene_type:complete
MKAFAMSLPTIGFLGIGMMGAPMARALLRAGLDVRVWNRSTAKAEALAADGAVIASTAALAVAKADIVVSMLSDGPATAQVLTECARGGTLCKGQIWIEMASVKPDEARAQAYELAVFGVDHLDAPVSGGTDGATAATLAIMVGGDVAVFERAKTTLAVMGTPTWVGPSGTGQLAKLANQGIVAMTIGAVAEAMLLLQKGGADPAAVRKALKGGFADSTILQLHGARMTDNDFAPRGRAAIQLKDLNNIVAESCDLGLTLPMTVDMQIRYDRLCTEMGAADLDHAALFLELLDRNQAS